ncbi:hypothetical protein TIFTF001_035221 [Ficus carica]|uniref:Uncharacterized protein n=1 Tax=Ficus carica TaxID=3494 RepID=A0AA88E2Y5_FICCA|nr:hypothetical protein TIFTF001_035221 [Ficus carica]
MGPQTSVSRHSVAICRFTRLAPPPTSVYLRFPHQSGIRARSVLPCMIANDGGGNQHVGDADRDVPALRDSVHDLECRFDKFACENTR